MTAESKNYEHFLEQHIHLLNALSDALVAGKSAIVNFRVADLEESIARQKHLCIQIASLNTEIRRTCLLASSQRAAGNLPQLLQDARNRLQSRNREHQALLQRSRRTVNAMLNGLRSFEGDYAAEALQQTISGAVLQERA